MSSPRVLASLVAVGVAGVIIASCGDQPSPTTASRVTMPPPVMQTSAAAFTDMLADPTPLTLGTKATTVVYPPNTAYQPWPPGPPPKADPGIPVPTDPSTSPRMHIIVNPEPVTHSGVPLGVAGCDNHPYTWYYDQQISNDTGLTLTLTQRTNYFDGHYSSTNPETIQIGGNKTVIVHTRWCSGYAKPHYTQTIYKGRDETGNPIEFSGPWVRLLTP